MSSLHLVSSRPHGRGILPTRTATEHQEHHHDTAGGESNDPDEDHHPVAVGDGCCPLCGIQLYKWKPKLKKLSLLLYCKKRLVPVDIEGKVMQGHCLACEYKHQLEEEVTATGGGDPTTTTASSGGSSSSNNSAAMVEEGFVFEGEYNIYGQRHGPGEIIWGDGDRYVGNFFNGTRDGSGKLFLRDGSHYDGDWGCDQMHGTGERTFPNGDTFVGEYRFGKRSGKGKYFFANGELYVGTFGNNLFHGSGKMYYPDGQVLQGHFEKGLKDGKFKWQHPDGKLDIIRFDLDEAVGSAVRWSASRCKTWLLPPPTNGTSTRRHGNPGSHDFPKQNHLFPKVHHKPKACKRIPIAQAVSIGFDCENGSPGEQELAISHALRQQDRVV